MLRVKCRKVWETTAQISEREVPYQVGEGFRAMHAELVRANSTPGKTDVPKEGIARPTAKGLYM